MQPASAAPGACQGRTIPCGASAAGILKRALSLWRLLPLLPLTACAGGERGCAVTLANASGEPIEQVYVARPGSGAREGGGWGTDLLAPAELAPGEARSIRLPGGGGVALRAIWASGRAAEMQGVEACRIGRITVRDEAVQAE